MYISTTGVYGDHAGALIDEPARLRSANPRALRRGIAIAALVRGAPARVYNAVDDSVLKMGDYFDAVADATGLPRPPRLPRAELKEALSPMAYSFMTESRRLANRRLKRELHVRLVYPTVASALAALDAAISVKPATRPPAVA